MSDAKQSYNDILKATSLFGGVQIFGIIISLLRSKVIAILLGPTGMGIAGLLNTTINTIGGILKLGLDTSAVKELSAVHAEGNHERVSLVGASLNRIIWFTAVFAAIFVAILSPLLSEIAFGNRNYILAFVWLSIALLFRQLTIGKMAILQGLRKKALLAKANIVGGFLSLIVSVPLYYFYRIDAIVPAIIISSIIVYLVGWYFTGKINLKFPKISNNLAFSEGKTMIKLGVTLSVMSMFTLLTAYGVQIYISHYGGLDEVGFYLAGFVIIDSYVGMVFSAMQTDYFPKLSAISTDQVKLNQAVMDQAVVGLLLLTPIIVMFLTAAPFFIKLLYSKDFMVIVGMVSWGILGSLFKAMSFSLGYVILAKGDSKVFLKTSFVFNIILLAFSILGYHFGGLTGIGIGFLVYYTIHFYGLKIVIQHIYGLRFTKELIIVFLTCILICAIAFAATWIENDIVKYSLLSVMSLISIIFTLVQINRKINIVEGLHNFMKRNDKTH